MLKTRIISALLALPVVLAAFFLLPPRGFGVALLAVVVVGAVEWARLQGLAKGSRALFTVGMLGLGAALLFGPFGFARGWPAAVVLTVCATATLFWVFAAPAWVVRRWRTSSRPLLGALGFLVLTGVFVALVELQARSPWLVLAAMAVVWIADTAAYFAGRAFGRHKLAPLVSPGKTWEGVAGALVAVALYALALLPFARDAGWRGTLDAGTVALWVLFVVALAAVSIVGDLFESLLKRHAGVKDSGNILPGHGGVLDRSDALLAAMPPAALAALLFLQKS